MKERMDHFFRQRRKTTPGNMEFPLQWGTGGQQSPQQNSQGKKFDLGGAEREKNPG